MANSWFDKSPTGVKIASANWKAHIWGRQQFAGSFATGGTFASTVFAPTRKDALTEPWKRKHAQGTPEHMRRLRRLQEMHGTSPKIKKAIDKANKAKPKGLGGGMLGVGLGAAFVALPAFTTEGPAAEKARAVTSGLGAWAGWEVGSKAGLGIGAAIGSLLGPIGSVVGGGIGWLAGGLTGSIAGEEATDALTRIPDRMVDKERNRRNLNWGVHTAAFQTQRAHTMRQQSLAAMNRGQMSARSLLGQEAVFVHR